MPLPRAALPVLVIAALGGCFPVTLYYREGTPVARIEAAETRCHVAALREVPEARRSRYIPPTYSYRTACNAEGQCQTVPIFLAPGRWETYDANEGLRAQVAQLCMRDQGFQKVRLRPCGPSVVEATRLTATQIQPRLGPNSCIIRLKTGRYKIVTPGIE